MKKVCYKISSALVVMGFVFFLWFFRGDTQTFEMTEEEAAKTVFFLTYIQIVTMIMTQWLFPL